MENQHKPTGKVPFISSLDQSAPISYQPALAQKGSRLTHSKYAAIKYQGKMN